MAQEKKKTGAVTAFVRAGTGSSVRVFIDTLTQTPIQANQLKTNLTRLKSDLDEIIKVLTYPKTVADDLGKLNTVLNTISPLLTAVSIIPEIGTEVKVIQEAVDSLKAEISSAKNIADKIERQVKPIRDALSKLDPILQKGIDTATQIASKSQDFLTHFTAINDCINSLPDGSAKAEGLKYLSSFSATATPFVKDLNTGLNTVNRKVEGFYNAITEIKNQLDFMSEIIDAVSQLLSSLSPLLGPLKSLESILDTKITIPTPVPFYGVHVSIRDILTDFKAFMDLAMKILDPVLGPILQPLKDLMKSIISQIPGIKQLLGLEINIPSVPDFSYLFDNFTVLLSKLEAVLDKFSLDCPPATNQINFAAEIGQHMKDVEDCFGKGGVLSINLGPKKHLVASKGTVAVSSGAKGKTSLFRAKLDLGKCVLFTASNRRYLAVRDGALVLIKGPATPAAHFEIIAKGDDKFSLKDTGGKLVEMDGQTVFTAMPD